MDITLLARWTAYREAQFRPDKAVYLQRLIDLLGDNIAQVEEAYAKKDFQKLLKLFPLPHHTVSSVID